MQLGRLILILLSITLLTTSCKRSAPPVSVAENPSSVNGVQIGSSTLPRAKALEDMSWTKLDGFEQKLRDLRGKAVILDFWATYCKPCLEEIPHLMELEKKYGKENLVLVGLHVGGDEDRPKIPEFVERLGIGYTLGIPELALQEFVFAGTKGEIPQTAVFDRRGNMVAKFIGFDPETKSKLDEAVSTAVQSK